MLSGDAAMSSVAPFKSHDLLLLMCDHASAGLIVQKEVEEMKLCQMPKYQVNDGDK